jgi:hypothetical protein
MSLLLGTAVERRSPALTFRQRTWPAALLAGACDRGQLDTVNVLVQNRVPLEVKSMYGGTVLSTAVWAAINEPKPEHILLIEALIIAGARPEGTNYPSGDTRVDEALRRYRTTLPKSRRSEPSTEENEA